MSVVSGSTKALYEEFYARFQASRTALFTRVQNLQAEGHTGAVQELVQEVAQLRRSLVDNISLLPSYDQRQCELQMAALEKILESLRSSSSTKPRFSFKRGPSTKPSSVSQLENVSISPAVSAGNRLAPSTFRTLTGHSNKFISSSFLPPATAGQSDLTVADLDHCVLALHAQDGVESEAPEVTALHIRNLRDCIVILPPILGSVIVHSLTRCIVAVTCRQFRMHASSNLHIYLRVTSNPIIEHCTNIGFAPYPEVILQASMAASISSTNMYNSVQDFSHIRATPSPNWTLLRNVGGDGSSEVDWPLLVECARMDNDEALRKYLPWEDPAV